MDKETITQMVDFLEKGFECLGYLLPHIIKSHTETDPDGKKFLLITETFDTDKLDDSVPDTWKDDVDSINSAFHSEWGGHCSENDGSVTISIKESE